MKRTLLFCSFSILVIGIFGSCAQTSFPSSNDALTGSGTGNVDIKTVTSVNGIVSISAIDCLSGGIANQIHFGQLNIPYASNSTTAANVCAVTTAATQTNLPSGGTFVFT